ncbi:unnamed protein product [Mycena citricolor]|uniref:Peptidase S54 rhomboid domain-containing protein n=1 Tax=Mycena citricolor TaxID=2018698 RepID=A0AAD2HF20_9AGAR|nr:unnamed protein product [Mycena citricolor]
MPTKVPRRAAMEDDPFARVIAPPQNESPEERDYRLHEERVAKQISDAIDASILREQAVEKKRPKPVKILLLGQSESGKSTTLKNFQLLYEPKAFRAERASWRAIIQLNIVQSIHIILTAMTRSENIPPTPRSSLSSQDSLRFDSDLLALRSRLQSLLEIEKSLLKRLSLPGSTEVEATERPLTTRRRQSREVAINSSMPWKGAFARMTGGSNRDSVDTDHLVDWDDPEDPGVVLHSLREDMKRLWEHPTVQAILERQSIRLQESAGFFLDSIDEVTSLRYVPTDDHILRARLKTLGVSEHRMRLTDPTGGMSRDFRLFDVGGTRSLRHAWVSYFDDMDACIFLCPISAFDQVLAEEPTVNRLADSYKLYTAVVSNKLLQQTNMILFLNKVDIMHAKLISGIRLADYVDSYGKRPNDFDSASRYLKKQFQSILKQHSPIPRVFYCHLTNAIDTKSTRYVLAGDQINLIVVPVGLDVVVVGVRGMASAPKRRVSYIIPAPVDPVPRLVLPNPTTNRLGRVRPLLIPDSVQPAAVDSDPGARSRHPRHRLGISALALDASTLLTSRHSPEGILYTGGRDGLVISWDLGFPMRRRSTDERDVRKGRWEALTGWADDSIDEEDEGEGPTSDGDVLGDVTSSLARRRMPGVRETPYEEQWEVDPEGVATRSSTFRQCAQSHTDWVNDILLCNYNQTLVSASSDGTVQAWTPHGPSDSQPSLIGRHSDYVRCLSGCRTQNWVASGSFDRTIALWDLGRSQASPDPLVTLQPVDAQSPKCSVYALAADPFGHAIASGGPERVVRMWDPRSGKRSGKLVGHTDNIRAILLSEDSKYALLMVRNDLRPASLSYHNTFSLHQTVVSCQPTMSAHIYPSRGLGLVAVLGTSDAGDILRWRPLGFVSRVDVSSLPNDDVGDGECVLICKEGEESPTGSAVSGQGLGGINKLVVADDTFVWTATSSSSVRRWRIPTRGATNMGAGASSPRQSPPVDGENDFEGRSIAPSVLSWEGDDDGDNRHGIAYASLIRLTSPNDPYPVRSAGRDAEVATLYSAASVLSVPALRSPHLPSSPHGHVSSPRAPPHPNSREAYFGRELAADATALVGSPDPAGTLSGERGLVRALILNDRVHAVSVDTGGEVAVWDLVRGTCVGVIPLESQDCSKEDWAPREALERVRECIEGEAVVNGWATVDTKSGVLAVHVNERSFESEIYADEVGFAGDRRFGDEAKFPAGYAALCFARTSRRVAAPDADDSPPARQRAHTDAHYSGQHRCRHKRCHPDAAPAESSWPLGSARKEQGDYFNRPRHTSMQGGATPGAEDFSGWGGPSSVPNATPSTPTGLMGRLKSFGKKRAQEMAMPPVPAAMPAPVVETVHPEAATKTQLQILLATPLSPPPSNEAPTLGLNSHVPLLIEEENANGFTVKYRGTIGSTSADAAVLEEVMPPWLIEYLLFHRMPSSPPQIKVSFVLVPWAGDNQQQLPELINSAQSKLTASRQLRVRKLLVHVQEKLEKLEPPPPDVPRARPEDSYEILCNDVVLPMDMTIAAVRQKTTATPPPRAVLRRRSPLSPVEPHVRRPPVSEPVPEEADLLGSDLRTPGSTRKSIFFFGTLSCGVFFVAALGTNYLTNYWRDVVLSTRGEAELDLGTLLRVKAQTARQVRVRLPFVRLPSPFRCLHHVERAGVGEPRSASHEGLSPIPRSVVRGICEAVANASLDYDVKKVCWGFVAINISVFLAWRVPRWTAFMARTFIHYPLSGRYLPMVTSLFSHIGLVHLFFNCFALTGFGYLAGMYFSIEQADGPSKLLESTNAPHFAAFYITAGVFASLVSQLIHTRAFDAKNAILMATKGFRMRTMGGQLGASGAIYSCVMVAAAALPQVSVNFMFIPINIPIRWAMGAMVLFDVVGILRGWKSLGHHAHLAGAAFGLFYYFCGPQLWDFWRGLASLFV